MLRTRSHDPPRRTGPTPPTIWPDGGSLFDDLIGVPNGATVAGTITAGPVTSPFSVAIAQSRAAA